MDYHGVGSGCGGGGGVDGGGGGVVRALSSHFRHCSCSFVRALTLLVL